MKTDLIPIKRALISVSDKYNIEIIAETLLMYGCEIIASGGTRKHLESLNIKTTDITEITGNPEIFDGRIKTISFNIASGLLFDRDKHKDEALKYNVKPIDMVICNLYPFQKVKEEGAELDKLIENIDIGGPTMIRAAAKNFNYVSVITSPSDYESIIKELGNNKGNITYHTRCYLMRKAFNHTADYDSIISSTMDEQFGLKSTRFSFSDGKLLRYGENPHQKAYYYRNTQLENSLFDYEVLSGKDISFNNLIDIASSIDAVKYLKDQGCAIIKHNNPCGLAQGIDQRLIFELAWNGDNVSAYGSIIAFNKAVELDTVKFLELDNEDKSKHKFVEVIISPDFSQESIEYLKLNKNLRIIKYDFNCNHSIYDYKLLNGILLEQEIDNNLYSKLEVVSQKTMQITDDVESLINFGIIAVRQIKSNSIAIVRKTHNNSFQLLGMGAGQPNRLESLRIAIEKSITNLKKEAQENHLNLEDQVKTELSSAILISDAFFPFDDNVDICHKFGINIIVQPGGSIKDKIIINKCNELGLVMIFTGTRHFKH